MASEPEQTEAMEMEAEDMEHDLQVHSTSLVSSEEDALLGTQYNEVGGATLGLSTNMSNLIVRADVISSCSEPQGQ